MFRRFVECQLARVRQCPQASMLGARVYERLEDALRRIVELIAGSTTTHMISQAVADNLFATAFPDLITDAERTQGEAGLFWYHMGSLAAFAKLLGSTDLHFQNILCCQTTPYIIDLETMLSPISSERLAYLQLSGAEKQARYRLRESIDGESASRLLF